MPHPLSILIMGSDASEIAAVATQLESEPDFKPIGLDLSVETLDQNELDYIDALLILPKADPAKWKALLGAQYRAPLIGLGFSDEELSEQINLPVKASFLVQRIKALIRNFQSRSDYFISVGSFKLYPASRHLLSHQGDELKLTDKEVEILRYLHRARGAIVSREELLTNIWGYHESVTTHTTETHIYRLRQKIETNSDEAAILITEPGGYRLAETVKES